MEERGMIKNHNCKFSKFYFYLNLNIYFINFLHTFWEISSWSLKFSHDNSPLWILDVTTSTSSSKNSENLQILWNTTRDICWVRWEWWNKTFCWLSRVLPFTSAWTRDSIQTSFFNTLLVNVCELLINYYIPSYIHSSHVHWIGFLLISYMENRCSCCWRCRWRRDILIYIINSEAKASAKVLNDPLDIKNCSFFVPSMYGDSRKTVKSFFIAHEQ